MAGRKAGRAVGGVVRAYEGKTVKLTITLRPADAVKLRIAAVGLGVDLGDLVTAGLVEVLAGIEARVRVLSSGCEGTEPGQPEAPALRVG
jgi:hypothetical protein